MSASEKSIDETGSEREARLRVDARKVADARALLADIDARVFASARRHTGNAHGLLIARIVAALFADG
jgi:hypothetical protein